MARAAQILAENGVSIEEVVQGRGMKMTGYLPACTVFITHHTAHAPLSQALAALHRQTRRFVKMWSHCLFMVRVSGHGSKKLLWQIQKNPGQKLTVY